MRELLEKIKGRRVVVIGDVMIDHYLHGDCHRISPEAPVPVVHVDRERHVAGGAANVAINVRALGGDAVLCGMTGLDSAGDELAALLAREGVAYPASFSTGRRDDDHQDARRRAQPAALPHRPRAASQAHYGGFR